MFKNTKPKYSVPNLSGQNLSKEEGDTLKGFFGTLVDIIVAVTGGKPSFPKK